MSKTINVKPKAGRNCPPHPTAGALPADGGQWPADQFTFRRLRDGDIEKETEGAPAATAAAPEAIPEKRPRRGG